MNVAAALDSPGQVRDRGTSVVLKLLDIWTGLCEDYRKRERREIIEQEPSEAKLAEFEASTQKLQYKNLELRLRLQRRKSRAAFERRLLLVGGPSLLLLGLVVGIFLGLVVGSVRP